MVALVPRLPRSRKPRGYSQLAHSAAVIGTAKTHWLPVCLAGWLCIALLGVCVTSTRSFRASDANLWSAAPETASAATSHKASSLQGLCDGQTLCGTRSHGCASPPVGARVYGHHGHGTSRVVRGTLAAVSLKRSTWFEGEALKLWVASPARGPKGSLLSQAATKSDFGIARVCFLSPRLSILFSASSLVPPVKGSSYEVNDEFDEPEGSERHDVLREQNESDLSVPAELQLIAQVHEAKNRKRISLKKLSARVGSALTAILQKVQATKARSPPLRESTGFSAGRTTFEPGEAPSGDGQPAVLSSVQNHSAHAHSSGGLLADDTEPRSDEIRQEDGDAGERVNHLQPVSQNEADLDDQGCGESTSILQSDADASLSSDTHLWSSSGVSCEAEAASSSPNEQSETGESRWSAVPDGSEVLEAAAESSPKDERPRVEQTMPSPQHPETNDAASGPEEAELLAPSPSSGGQLDSAAASTEEELRLQSEPLVPTNKKEQARRDPLEAARLQSARPHVTGAQSEAEVRPKLAIAKHEEGSALREDLPKAALQGPSASFVCTSVVVVLHAPVLRHAVSEDLLAILQKGPVKQQAIAARALTAVVASESKRSTTHAQAYLTLPGLSQHACTFASRETCRSNSGLVDHLLRKGLVDALQRILSARPPKPFWSRWLQRDVSVEDDEALELLQLRVQLLRLLTALLSFGTEVERHIAEHGLLIKALYRLAKPSSAGSVRAYGSSCSPAGPRQTSPELSSPCHSSQPSAANGVTDLREAEAPSSEAGDNGRSNAAERGTTNDGINSPPTTNRSLQSPSQSASDLSSHKAVQRSGTGAYTTHGDSASGCDASRQPSASPPFGGGASATRMQTAGASMGGGTDAAKGIIRTDFKSHAREPAHGQASLSVSEDALSVPQILRMTAEKLALEVMDRLSGPTGEAAAGSPESAYTAGGMQVEGNVKAVKSMWWKSFLVPFGSPQSTGAPAVHRIDAGEARSKAVPSTSQPPEGLPATWKSAEGAELGLSQGPEADEADEGEVALDTCNGAGGLRICRRVCSAWIPRSLKALRAKPGAANNERKSKVFWIPVCLSAGDAGLWASLAAVAGEDLAAALKGKVIRHLQATQRQQPATIGETASLSSPSSELLSLLHEITIGSCRSSGSHTAAWGVIGLTIEEMPSTRTGDLEGASHSGISELNGTETAALSGEVVAKNSRYHFQMLCLLRDHPSLRGSIQTLGICHLLNAVSSGTPEAKLGALETLTQLLRSAASGTSQNIRDELSSDVLLHAFEQGLAEALLAPYSRRRFWAIGGSEAACLVLENLQVAALDFLYALCVADESLIQTLQECTSVMTALHRVIRFCKRTSSCSSPVDRDSSKDTRDSSRAPAADDPVLLKVANGLPPGERHMKVLQEHARPLRLATIVASALGAQPKWKPRVPGQRGLRILALDGGGTRGVLTVAVLKLIAASVGRELNEVFDIICGTSTGGIIAVLLGMEKASAVELEALYDTLINEIFVKDSAAVAGARLVVRQAYYDESLWESLLQRAFGDTRMIEFAADESVPKVFCLSTMMSTNPAKLVVWRNYNYPATTSKSLNHVSVLGCIHRLKNLFLNPQKTAAATEKKRYNGFCCVRVRDALRATTAAPGFFIGKKIGADFFVDGALLANNPAAVAIAEAKALYPGVPIEVVVSVGTGQCPSERCDARTGWDGIFNQLVNAATNTESIHELLKEVLPESVYFRLNPEIDAIPIDETSRERLQRLKFAAKRFFEDPRNKDTIQRLVDILRPAYPLEKHTRVVMRSISRRTASLGRWILNVGSNSLKAVSRSVHGPLSISDSSLVRLMKCCLLSAKGADNAESNTSSSILRGSSEEKGSLNSACSPGTGTLASGSELECLASARVEEPCESASETNVKHQTQRDGALLSLDAHVFPGGRRSFLAWLLRSPRSTPGKGSSGIFDMLELLGRRHLSSVRRKELESLVPLTGVRHVLHGIFQLVGGQF
ncbi:hypothetical protein Esti_001923 [Eimeria stiedai]